MGCFENEEQGTTVTMHQKERGLECKKAMRELATKDDEDTDVMMTGIHECYTAKPKSTEGICLASFAADYTTSKEEPVMNEIAGTHQSRKMRTHDRGTMPSLLISVGKIQIKNMKNVCLIL